MGDAALMLRMRLEEADARAQFIEQVLVSGWLSAVEVEPEVAFDGNLRGGAASLEYRARSQSLARREGEDLVLVLAPPMPMTARLAPLTERTLAVVLPPSLAPLHQHVSIEIVAPEGYRFADLPPDETADGGPFGRASVSFARGRPAPGGRPTVTVRREVAFEQSRIEVGDYPRWRGWLQRIDRLLRRGVRLVPR